MSLGAKWGWGLMLMTALFAEAKAPERDKDVLPMSVTEAVLCRDLQRTSEELKAVDPGDRFSTSAVQVVSLVRFQHVLKPHKLRWRWYDPQGNLYLESEELEVAPAGKYHKAYSGSHAILIQGERAMMLPGAWKVVAYLDGAVASTTGFVLSAEKVTP